MDAGSGRRDNPSGPPPDRGTRVITVDPGRPDEGHLRQAAACLRDGGLVAFPTETVYGLGADATNPVAVRAVFAAKGRPADNPLIVHVSAWSDVEGLLGELPPLARRLAGAFWPGPLSLVLRHSGQVPPEVTGGLDTVAVRMPDHPVALALIRLAGVPVAAPSANASGRPSPTRACDVLNDLDGRIDYLVDAGPTPVGVESTVLDLTGVIPVVLRPGGVTVEELRRVVGEVAMAPGPLEVSSGVPGGPPGGVPGEPPRSPGLRHQHYSPRARVLLTGTGAGEPEPGSEEAAAAVADRVRAEAAAGRRVGVACSRETAERLTRKGEWPAGTPLAVWGSATRPAEVAVNLFAVLRDLDRSGVETIVAEPLAPVGLGLAVNDRLVRAAEPEPDTILVVCTGNTCRSPMAEVLLTDLLRRSGLDRRYRVLSAGTDAVPGVPATPEAVDVMRRYGLDLSGHRARAVAPEHVGGTRLILTMTRRHLDALADRYPEAADRVFTLRGYSGLAPEDISDPIGQGFAAYERAAAEIEEAVARAVENLRNPPDLRPLLGPGRATGSTLPDEESSQ